MTRGSHVALPATLRSRLRLTLRNDRKRSYVKVTLCLTIIQKWSWKAEQLKR